MKRFALPIGATLLGLATGLLGLRLFSPRETRPSAETTPISAIARPARTAAEVHAFVEQRLGKPDGERSEWYQTERKRLRQPGASPYRSSALLDQAIEGLSGEQLVEMLKHRVFSSVEEISQAFGRLAEIDPVWALEKVLGQTPLTIPQLNEAIVAVFATWVSTDPNGALDWCYRHPPDGGRQQCSLTLTDEWLKVDPAAVAKNYDRLENARGPGSFSAGFPDKLMRAWVAKDADAAGEWVASLATGQKKTELQQAYLKAGGGK